MLSVNTNLASLNAQINLNASSAKYSQALQRLSSGLRINSAADDAAGLAISTRLNSQYRGLNQAIRNANDGQALLGTAEGALNEITSIVTRIKELAVQSVNSTNSSTDRSSLNSEVSALISEVTRIATQTKFGSTTLLDGSFSGTFQVGTDAGQTVTASLGNFRSDSLSTDLASQSLTFVSDVTSTFTSNASAFTGLTATGLLISGGSGTAYTRATAASDDTTSNTGNATSAIAVAKVINEATSTTGVTATVTSSSVTVAGIFTSNVNIDGTNQTLKINGQSVTGSIGASTSGINSLVSLINAQVSGVVATSANATGFTLTATDGRNISVQVLGTSTTGSVSLDVFNQTAGGYLSTERVVARGGVTLTSAATFTTTPANTAQIGGEGTATATPTALSTVDISTASGANQALIIADGILDSISSSRGDIGAIENRLTSTVNNLSVVAEKVADANSRITDADFAAETANLTKAQILQNAGISILSQANSTPQLILKLLQ
jgi:flagellin